jgi:hypothetical protein
MRFFIGLVLALALMAGCSDENGEGGSGGGGSGGSADQGTFANARRVANVSTATGAESAPFISIDGKLLLWSAVRPEGLGGKDIYVATRTSTDDEFSAPMNFNDYCSCAINTEYRENYPYMPEDGLTLYWNSLDRPGGPGHYDIWYATRASIDDPFGEAAPMNSINTPYGDSVPRLSKDQLTMFFVSTRPGGERDGVQDIWVATRASKSDEFSNPINANAWAGTEINLELPETGPSISGTEAALFFSDSATDPLNVRPGGEGQHDIWVALRDGEEGMFGEPINLNDLGIGSGLEIPGAVNTELWELQAYVTPDWPARGATMVYVTNRDSAAGAFDRDIWVADWTDTLDASQ